MTVAVLRHRPSVRFARIAPAGFRLLAALDGATTALGRDLEVTAGTDSHTAGRHPIGEAYDVSVTGWAAADLEELIRHLRQRLGPRFTVLYEVPRRPSHPRLAALATVNAQATGPHLHLQPKKGTRYPPEGDPLDA